MSKLSSPDDILIPNEPPRHEARILRHRKKRPLHPDTIQDMLRERADARSGSDLLRPTEWLLILWREDESKRFSDLHGSYKDVCKQRDDIMESGEYDKAWLILKTEAWKMR
jgi:hypothetical protein